MGKEFELKFAATAEKQALVEKTYGKFAEIAMETTYFDTPAMDFSSRKMTLRTRLENGRCICTLKAPMGPNSRKEFEVEESDIHAAIPMLCKLSGWQELENMTPVQPVCGARFIRRAKALTLDECTVELALDRGVLTAGSREIPLCEIEVELKEGSEAAAALFARVLAAQFSLRPEPKSKFRRAMDLAQRPESR